MGLGLDKNVSYDEPSHIPQSKHNNLLHRHQGGLGGFLECCSTVDTKLDWACNNVKPKESLARTVLDKAQFRTQLGCVRLISKGLPHVAQPRRTKSKPINYINLLKTG